MVAVVGPGLDPASPVFTTERWAQYVQSLYAPSLDEEEKASGSLRRPEAADGQRARPEARADAPPREAVPPGSGLLALRDGAVTTPDGGELTSTRSTVMSTTGDFGGGGGGSPRAKASSSSTTSV